jgi:FMN phosphatase YigB (HAD superfamily)
VRRAPYRAVLFDLVDTLIRFQPARLPLVRVGAREVRSSAGRLWAILAAAVPGLDLERFHEAFVWSYREAERRRAANSREVPAPERLGLLYARLGLPPGSVPERVTEALLAAHMACLVAAAEPVPGRALLFDWLGERFPLGVVSNFDYSPTVHRVLEADGLRARFRAVIVSDAVGWRKPEPVIFQTALAAIGATARETLFVGDRPDIDVVGARRAGMAVAWLNAGAEALPAGLPAPDHEVRDLAGVLRILEENT